MADFQIMVSGQKARYLLWTKVLADIVADQLNHNRCHFDTLDSRKATCQGSFVCLARAIPFVALIAPNFAADSRLVNSYAPSNA